MNFLRSDHLFGSEFTRATAQRIHADWAKCIGDDVADYERIFQDHLTNLRDFLPPVSDTKLKGFFHRFFGKTETREINKEAAYRFAMCFASTKFLTGYGARQATQQQLNLINAEHLALIDQLLDLPDETLTETPFHNDAGTMGDVVQATLHVYFHHSDFGPQGARLRSEAALRIPKLLRRFPYLDSNLTVSLFAAHPDLIPEAASLIRDVFCNPGHTCDQGPYGWIAQDMTGFHARREDPFQKHGPKIMAQVLKDAAQWPTDQLSNLAEVFALGPLDLTIGTPEQEIETARSTIAREEAKLAQGFDGPDNPLPPQQAKKLCRDRIKAAKARLSEIETNYDGLRNSHINAAAKHLAKATGARKTVDALTKTLPEDLTAPLIEVLAKAHEIKNRPPTFPMPKAADNRFKDLGLKLMVIDELMYTQKHLLPVFDIRQFAKEWIKREISIEDDGYEIIPEAKTYFKNLAIPDELLAEVEVLTQKSGLDGGSGVIQQIMPFWDPGSGDGPVPVTNKAVADLDLLPNLKCVVGLEHEVNRPKPSKLLKELEARGIKTVDEDLAF